MESAGEVTRLLTAVAQGDRQALDEMLPLVYDELRRLADAYLRDERPDHTLQPTALVHEAYLQLVNQRTVDWRNRAHFIGVAANLMRRILVKHAREKKADKRGGAAAEKITLDRAVGIFEEQNLDVLEVDLALERLASLDERKARVIELRFFGGLTTEEIAEVAAISTATVERDYTFARAWLYRELQPRGATP